MYNSLRTQSPRPLTFQGILDTTATPLIIALFLEQEQARKGLVIYSELRPWDPRLQHFSLETIKAIGFDHPVIRISPKLCNSFGLVATP